MKQFMLTPKITLLTIDYPPMQGGVARYLSELVAESQGEIQVILPVGAHGMRPQPEVEGVIVRKFFWKAWPKWLPIINVILRDVPRDQVLLISHVIPVGTAAWIATFFGGPSYALLFHGTDILRLSNPWKRWLVRRICSKSKHLFANSEQTRRLLIEVIGGSKKIDVITPGVSFPPSLVSQEEAREQLHVLGSRKIVITVARLVKRKGIDTALHVMSKVNAKRTEKIQYVVIGDGPEKEMLQQLAARLKVEAVWLGEVDDATKWKWLCASNLFLLPGSRRKDDIEGFGIVLLEAGFAGLPVVAGNTGGTAEAVTEGVTGWMIEPEGIQKMAGKIEEVIDSPQIGIDVGERARVIVRSQFQWRDRWQKVRSVLLS